MHAVPATAQAFVAARKSSPHTAQTAKIDNLIAGLLQITKQRADANKLDLSIREQTLAKIRRRQFDIETQLISSGSEAITPLVESLDTWNEEAGHIFARTLGKFGPQIAGPLISNLADRPPGSRERACLVVYGAESIESCGSTVNESLQKYLLNSSPHLREATLQLIEEIAADCRGINSLALSGQLVEEVCRALRDNKEFVRIAAAACLGRIGPRNQLVSNALCDSARTDPDAAVRRASVTALGEIASGQTQYAMQNTVETLSFVLKNDEFDGARAAAAEALGKTHNSSSKAVSALIAGLKDPVKSVQEKSISSLRTIGPTAGRALPDLLESMTDLSNNDINLYCGVLERFGENAKPALPIIMSAIRSNGDEYGETTYSFARFAQALGPAGSPAVPLLIEMLTRRNSGIYRGDHQKAIFDALTAIGPGAKESLIELSLRSTSLKDSCDRAIKEIGNASDSKSTPQVSPPAIQLFDSWLMIYDVSALAAVGADRAQDPEALVDDLYTAASAVETRIENERDFGQDSRQRALSDNRRRIAEIEKKLLALGPVPIPLLVQSTLSADQLFAGACARVLAKFGPQIVRPIILEFSTSQNPRGNRSLEYGYDAIGSLGPEAVPPLKLLLQDKSADMQISTLSALRTLARKSFVLPPELIGSVRACADSGNDRVRGAAVLALGEIGPRNPELLQTLYSHLRSDPSAAVRRSCAVALGSLVEKQSNDAASKTIDELGAALVHDEFPGTRIASANALRHGHNSPARAVDALTQGIADPVLAVQLSCIQALSDFGGQSASALPTIISQVKAGRDAEESSALASLLNNIGPTAAIALPSLLANLPSQLDEGQNATHQGLAAFCMKLGKDAVPAVPVLIRMLNNKYDRRQAIAALGAIGPPAAAAIPALEHVAETDPDCANQCRSALSSIRGNPQTQTEENRGQLGGI